MKMTRRLALAVLASSVAPLVSAGAANAADPLRIALLPVDPAAAVYYARELGYFGEVGIEPRIEIIQAGSAVVSAVLAGALDIGWSNPISIAAARLRGLPLVAIAPGGLYLEHDVSSAIVVPKSSSLRTARDLAGKTMAVSGLKTLGQWGPAAWIDKNGGDSASLRWVEMPFPDMPLALAQQRVDAAFVAEPFITLAKDARVFVDALAAVAPRFAFGAWVTTTAFADAHREPIARFAAAMAKAGGWANEHREQSAAILAKYGKLDPDVARKMTRVAYATRLAPADLQPVLDLALRYGALPGPIRAETLIYSSSSPA